MKKQLFSLALWMFFGFVLVNAIDSVLSFIVNAYFHISLFQELSVKFLTYSIPILTFIIYCVTSIFVTKYLLKKTVDFELDKIKLPTITYAIAIIITIVLNPLQNKLSGLLSADLFSSKTIYNDLEILDLYGLTTFSIATCRWLSIIILSIYFYRVYKKSEIKTEQ